MSKLGNKIRKAREQRVEAGGKVFLIRRPTDLDMLEFRAGLTPRALMAYVIGWEGVTEADIIGPAGDPHPLDFDPDACAEWLADAPELFSELVSAILGAYSAHRESVEAAKKN